jgi:hypothetical protein
MKKILLLIRIIYLEYNIVLQFIGGLGSSAVFQLLHLFSFQTPILK